ncbi:hypothetical protein F6B41_25530 [Microbacterium lushaniae]|nr:hypothetical protein F6B41_33810 [Microbacterium lushaniae]KAA9149516.1 hypothetical protein F6B41_25530 [Microbacterium lushaniae]
MEILRYAMLVAHFVGLAAVVGGYIFQLRAPGSLRLAPMLTGAIVQLVTGVLLVFSRIRLDLDVNEAKIAVKLGLAVLVLLAVIGASAAQRRDLRFPTRVLFHAAGVLAIGNVVVAVVWS